MMRPNTGALAGAMVLACAGVVRADAAKGIRVEATTPVAVRGGVIMLPLVAERPGDRWPKTFRMTLDDGRRINARVAWIEPAPVTSLSRWALDTAGLAARWVEPGDDTSAGTGAPYIVAQLPEDSSGPLRMGDQTLDVTWLDRPREEAPARPRGQLPFADHPGRPDRYSPFSYWRWVLLAERLDLEPPQPDVYGDPGSLIARHTAELWHAGLDRLRRTNPGIAAHCRDLLTQRCRDGTLTFAAWVADPAQVGALLGILLDTRRPERSLQRAVLAWADAQDLILIWPEPAKHDMVRVAIANPTFDSLVAKFIWGGGDRIPIAADVDPGTVTRIDLDRPPRIRPEIPDIGQPREPAPDVLITGIEGRRERFVVAPTVRSARPPAVHLSPLRPALSLLGLQRRGQVVAPQRATVADLRRREDRWEVFFECRRPAQQPSTADLDATISLENVLGIEAVQLLIGEGDDTITLVIPELGNWRVVDGAADGLLEVHRRSYNDRWLCRVVLPDAWVHAETSDSLLHLGVLRTHGGTGELESAPFAVLPWRRDPGRVSIDLAAWDG